MPKTEFDSTATSTESTPEQVELNERELDDATGGLMPAVGPAAKPASDFF